MAGEKIMFGRVVSFDHANPFAGTFNDTGKTYVTMCLDSLPAVGEVKPEVEITNTCSSAEEYIAGLAQGKEVTFTGHFRGASATDFGSGANALPAKVKAGSIIAVKDNLAQFASPMILRYDVTLLEWEVGGGGVKDSQKWMVRGRITNGVNIATS